jgi:hypothetical protein
MSHLNPPNKRGKFSIRLFSVMKNSMRLFFSAPNAFREISYPERSKKALEMALNYTWVRSDFKLLSCISNSLAMAAAVFNEDS